MDVAIAVAPPEQTGVSMWLHLPARGQSDRDSEWSAASRRGPTLGPSETGGLDILRTLAFAAFWVTALTVEADAELIREERGPGHVTAVCHFLSDGQMRNDFFEFFTKTGEVWFGDIYSGSRKAGRIIFVSERLLAAEVAIVGALTVHYFASVLIDLENHKYLKSEIRQHECKTFVNCDYAATAFEGKCHQIIGADGLKEK